MVSTPRVVAPYRPPASVRPGGRLARVLAAGLVTGCAAPGAVGGLAAQEPGGPPEVVEVRFEGASTFSRSALAGAIVTRATACRSPALLLVCVLGAAKDRHYLDSKVLQADLLRLRLFYFQHGYRDTTVDVEVLPAGRSRDPHIEVALDGNGPQPAALPAPSSWALAPPEEGAVRVVFRIDEGQPVRVAAVELEGGTPPLRPGVAADLPLLPGQPLSLMRYEASRDSLISLLRNEGYARGEVLASYFIPADAAEGARVRFEVVPGERARFGAIEVSGNERVSDGVVRRMLTFREGDLYRHAELQRSQQHLFGLAVFRHAEIRTDLDPANDTLIPVLVQVNEGNAYRVRLGAGLSTADCLNAEGRWTSRNFLGGARRLELRGQISNVLAEPLGSFPCIDTGDGVYSQLAGTVGADFTQPWVFGPRNNLRAGVFAERRSLPEVFVRTTRGGYIALERNMGPATEIGLSFRPELTELRAAGDLFFCVSFVACAERDIEVLQDPHWLAPLALSFARDRSNSRFAPTRGYLLHLDAEYGSAATGSHFSFVRATGELTTYRELHRGLVLASRLRGGVAESLREPGGSGLGLHPQKRFFAGGPNSVRGFAQHRLGPKVLTIDAVEYLARDTEDGGAGCTPEAINAGACDPNPVPDGRFEVRPVGGGSLLEGSLEFRFPITVERLRGAAFLDFGQVWSEGMTPSMEELAWTPGLGVRYFTPVGPLRVDLGYNTRGTESVPVITTRVARDEERGLVNTAVLRHLDTPYHWSPRASVLDRLQLHISIGQAF